MACWGTWIDYGDFKRYLKTIFWWKTGVYFPFTYRWHRVKLRLKVLPWCWTNCNKICGLKQYVCWQAWGLCAALDYHNTGKTEISFIKNYGIIFRAWRKGQQYEMSCYRKSAYMDENVHRHYMSKCFWYRIDTVLYILSGSHTDQTHCQLLYMNTFQLQKRTISISLWIKYFRWIIIELGFLVKVEQYNVEWANSLSSNRIWLQPSTHRFENEQFLSAIIATNIMIQ